MKTILENILKTKPNTLGEVVAFTLLNYVDVEERFNELHKNKSYSGAVPEFISLDFTHRLFDKYYDEIESIRKEYALCWMESEMYPSHDIKHDFTQFAIDYIIDSIADESMNTKKDSYF